MRFLSLVRISETGQQPSERLMKKMGKLVEEMTRSGTLKTFAPVGSSDANSTIRSMTPRSTCNAAARSPSGRTTR